MSDMPTGWNPRPPAHWDADRRKDYHAGYSDRWYVYPRGSSGIHQSQSDYDVGWDHAKHDQMAVLYSGEED